MLEAIGFIICFICFPTCAFLLVKYIDRSKILPWFKIFTPLLLLFDIAYYAGYSIRGDIADQLLFSLQYLLICLLIFGIRSNGKTLLTSIKILGYVVIGIGYLIGFLGIFVGVAFNSGPDTGFIRSTRIQTSDKTYEVRYYKHPSIDNIAYTYATYRLFNYSPFEMSVGEIIESEYTSKINCEDTIKMAIRDSANSRYLTLEDSHGAQLIRKIR